MLVNCQNSKEAFFFSRFALLKALDHHLEVLISKSPKDILTACRDIQSDFLNLENDKSLIPFNSSS